MRQSAKIIANSNLSVAILTKSSLIERDLDIWKEVNQKSGFTLMMSLTFADDKFRQIFEPNASSVDARIETLKKFKSAGISTGVMAMPFLPFISDSDENIIDLLEKLQDAKIDFIMPGLLTLRQGKQKEFYMNIIKTHFPQLTAKYQKLYGNNLQSGSPIFSYGLEMFEKINKLISSFDMLQNVSHSIYKDRFPLYDEIYILLNHMKNLYQKKDITNLRKASKRYSEWLINEKTSFNRRRKLRHPFLEHKLITLFENGEFENIIQNAKLYEFLKKVVIHRQTFDYRKLRLI